VWKRDSKMQMGKPLWIGIDIHGYILWGSLSDNKLECRKKIYDLVYKPFDEKFEFDKWTYRRVVVDFIDEEKYA